jgi:hypothetical protein
VAYFVSPMTDQKKGAESAKAPIECTVHEWDRKLIWAFTAGGVYLLSSPAMGKPSFAAPAA